MFYSGHADSVICEEQTEKRNISPMLSTTSHTVMVMPLFFRRMEQTRHEYRTCHIQSHPNLPRQLETGHTGAHITEQGR